MQIRPGSILIAHPLHANTENSKTVVYITESTGASTMGIILNKLSRYDLKELMSKHGIDWYGDREVYIGGEYNSQSLVMLHSEEWYSSNTMQVDKNFSISSDDLMIEKMEMGNTPEWYQLFIGCKGWDPAELGHELKSKKPKWLLLANPSTQLINSFPTSKMWQTAVAEYSQDMFSDYI
jgi:putative AlgH/UPF0301 family transcriptional regulator